MENLLKYMLVKKIDEMIKNNEGKSELLHMIVDCDEVTKIELEKFCEIKYELPIINAYAIVVKREYLEQLKSINGIVKIENDACLTAQSMELDESAYTSVNEEIYLNEEVYINSNLGKDIGVAVLDTGIYPHPDFINEKRLIGFKDFINDRPYSYDDNGHGTHVAGIIGGDGSESSSKYVGIAPKANLIGVKVLAGNGAGNISDVLAGIQWVFDNRERYNIKVINLSVGMLDTEGEQSILIKGVETAWDNGFFVVCAAGNNGPDKFTITTPGISKKVITVGSFTNEEPEKIANSNNYSSRGPTRACVVKPEVVAPGTNIISCSSDLDYNGEEEIEVQEIVGYNVKSGTSMATPVISGIIARMLSDFSDINNVNFKISLKKTSNSIGLSKYQEGWGLVNLDGLYYYFLEEVNQ